MSQVSINISISHLYIPYSTPLWSTRKGDRVWCAGGRRSMVGAGTWKLHEPRTPMPSVLCGELICGTAIARPLHSTWYVTRGALKMLLVTGRGPGGQWVQGETQRVQGQCLFPTLAPTAAQSDQSRSPWGPAYHVKWVCGKSPKWCQSLSYHKIQNSYKSPEIQVCSLCKYTTG